MKYYVVLSFVIGYLYITVSATTDLNNCIFNYWQVSWETAVKTCAFDHHNLLCYRTRKEMDDITEAFRLTAIGSAKLAIWLANRNCTSEEGKSEKCLSLHIEKSNNTVWHYFHTNCEDAYPFVCCINGTDETFNSSTNVEVSFSNTTNVKESISNATNLEESSKNTTDLEEPLQDTFPYNVQNETEPILEHGFKSKITGGFNRIKNIGTNVKNRIKGIGSGNGNSGNGKSGSYIHTRVTPNGNGGSGYVFLGMAVIIIGGMGITILVIYIREKIRQYRSSSKEKEEVKVTKF